MNCPNCGEECACDMVDVGVGEIQSGPYGCENCGWVEPDPARLLTNQEDQMHDEQQTQSQDETTTTTSTPTTTAPTSETQTTAQGDGDPGTPEPVKDETEGAAV